MVGLWALPLRGQVDGAEAATPLSPEEIRGVYQEAPALAREDLPAALTRLDRALQSALQHDHTELLAQGHQLAAQLCERWGDGLMDLRRAVNHYLDAIEACTALDDRGCIAESHYRAGMGFMRFGDHPEAIHHLLQSLARYEMMGDTLALLYCCQPLSRAFYATQAWGEAESYARRAIRLARQMGQDTLLTHSLVRMGQINQQRQNLAVAQGYLSEALELALRLDLPAQQAIIYSLLARSQPRPGRADEARRLYQKALDMARQLGLPAERAQAFLGLANLTELSTGPQTIQTWLDSAAYLARQHRLPFVLLEVYEAYTRLALAQRDLDDLYAYQQLKEQLSDSLDARAQENRIQRLHAQFEKQKGDLAIQNLRQRQALQDQQLKRQRNQVKFAIIIGLLLLALALTLYQQARAKQRINQRLESLVAQRTGELHEANQELDTFAYRTAHDIRGPVARLLGLCQIAKQEVQPSQTAQYLEMIYREAQNMDFMLHRFLEVNNIKHQSLSAEPIRLRYLLEDTLDQLSDLEHFSQIDFQIDVPPDLEILSDPEALTTIFKNLLENAITYVRADEPEPFLYLHARVRGNRVEVYVRDNGIGIEASVAPRIFEMFFRGTTVSKGLGLGLYATQLAVQKLEATIHYRSTQQGETEFLLDFPRAFSPKPKEGA